MQTDVEVDVEVIVVDLDELELIVSEITSTSSSC